MAEAKGTGIKSIPPIIFLLALLAGAGVNWALPVATFPEWIRFVIGPVMIVLSLALILPVILSFKRAKTPFDVRKAANALVTDGPFRFSRNPGYVSLIALCIGLGLVFGNVWMLIFVAIATIYLHRYVVLPEEHHLEANFGEAYLQYKQSVRRWL